MDADEKDESFLECLKIHGYITSSEAGSDEDESKSELDKLYEDYKPPPLKIDPAKHNVIIINDQSDGESSSQDECKSDKNFLHLEGFEKNFDDNKILKPTSDLQQGWTKTLSKRQRRKLKRRGTAINSELCYDQKSENLKSQCINSGNNSLHYLETNDFDLDKLNVNSELGTKNLKQKIKTQEENGGGKSFQNNDGTCSVVYSTLPNDFVKQRKPKARRRKKKRNQISGENWQQNLGSDFIREDINLRNYSYKFEDVTPSSPVEYPLYGYDNNSYDCEPCIRLNLMNDNNEERESCNESGSIKINELGHICSDNKIEETETWYNQIFENRKPHLSLKSFADDKLANGVDISVNSKLGIQKSEHKVKLLEHRTGDDFQLSDKTSSVVVGPIMSDHFIKKRRSKNRRRKKKKNQIENCELDLSADFTREVIHIRNYRFENVAPSASEYPLYGYDKYTYNCEFSVNLRFHSKILEENTKTKKNNEERNDRISNMVRSSVLSYFFQKDKSKNKNRKQKKEISKEDYKQDFWIRNFENVASWEDKTCRCECEYCDTGTVADYYLVDATSETSLGTYELPNNNRNFGEVIMEHGYDITRSVLRWTSSQIVFGILDSLIFRNPVDDRPTLRTHNFDDICFLLFDSF